MGLRYYGKRPSRCRSPIDTALRNVDQLDVHGAELLDPLMAEHRADDVDRRRLPRAPARVRRRPRRCSARPPGSRTRTSGRTELPSVQLLVTAWSVNPDTVQFNEPHDVRRCADGRGAHPPDPRRRWRGIRRRARRPDRDRAARSRGPALARGAAEPGDGHRRRRASRRRSPVAVRALTAAGAPVGAPPRLTHPSDEPYHPAATPGVIHALLCRATRAFCPPSASPAVRGACIAARGCDASSGRWPHPRSSVSSGSSASSSTRPRCSSSPTSSASTTWCPRSSRPRSRRSTTSS